uniref:Si:dkeyp-41f9.4 n=1 Tax=Sinocyclocheilus rhinocerous TaxID=307959 RepID=A0A673N3Z3_9TELE
PCALTHTSLCDNIAFIACKCSDRRETIFFCIVQMDPSASSECLQMIRSARNAEEQNLKCMKNGHLFFRAFKDIPENTELLVWYGRDLTKLLGLSTEQKNTKGFICSECKQRFLFEFPLLAHKRFFCIKKPASFLKELALPETYSVSSKPTTNFHNLAREQENCKKNRPNWCAKCNLSFQMTSDLVQHMRSHHKRALSDERQSRVRDERLKCPICKYVITSHVT